MTKAAAEVTRSDVSWRALELGDIERVRAWRNLPEIRQWMYTDHEIPAKEHARWFGQALTDPTKSYWIIQLDGIPVGLVNLYDISPAHGRAYWAFYLADPATRGRGVGSRTENFVIQHVFATLGLNKLCCEVLATNPGVVKLHERHGFSVDGTLRQHIRKGEDYVDVVTLSLLREEWLSAGADRG